MPVNLYLGNVDESFPSGFYEIFIDEFSGVKIAKDFVFSDGMKYYGEDRVLIIRDQDSGACLSFASFGLKETPIDKPTKEIVFFAEMHRT